ncbi:MAG: hypothetical protein AAF067_11235 [Pseudomonadota bacterium]
MTIGMAALILLASAGSTGEDCAASCAEQAELEMSTQEKPVSSGADCGTMTLQFKVGGEIREKQQQVCETGEQQH